MSVNLQKGQKVELRKSDGNALNQVMVGLGWDEANDGSQSIDCDATAFLCVNDHIANNDDIVYFGHLEHSSGSVKHMGDNLTGEGEGDDEQIFVNLKKLPSKYNKIIFIVNIYQASQRRQHFGMISNAFIRIIDADNDQELCKYNLSENYDGMTAMIFGELYLHNGQWKLNAIGQATKDDSISELAKRFMKN